MADYYPLIARAVANLQRNTDATRRVLYESARSALATQLRGRSEAEVARECHALDDAIRQVETEENDKLHTAAPRSTFKEPQIGNEKTDTLLSSIMKKFVPRRMIRTPKPTELYATVYSSRPETKQQSRLRGSKWVSICMLIAAGGAATVGESYPFRVTLMGLLMLLISLGFGVYSLFRVNWWVLGVAAFITLMTTLWGLSFVCTGECPPGFPELLAPTIIPAAIACAAGFNMMRHPGDQIQQGATGDKAIVSLLLGLSFWLQVLVPSPMNAATILISVIALIVTIIGLSLGVDALRSRVSTKIATAGIILNIIGLFVAGSILPYSLQRLNALQEVNSHLFDAIRGGTCLVAPTRIRCAPSWAWQIFWTAGESK